jgi:hypothetical protein
MQHHHITVRNVPDGIDRDAIAIRLHRMVVLKGLAQLGVPNEDDTLPSHVIDYADLPPPPPY